MKKSQLLLSAQNALLGKITDTMRFITVNLIEDTLFVKVWTNNTPNDVERDLLSLITTDICADISEIMEVKEDFEITTKPYNQLEMKGFLVYMKYENKV